jgi:hypothetical protein
MVWGDSTAMHLVDGIAASTKNGVVQVTKTDCGPFLGISAFSADGFYNRRWGEGCLRFNDGVIDYLATAQSVEVVVLASLYGQYLAGNRLIAQPDGTSGRAGEPVERAGGDDIAARSLEMTIAKIRSLKKRVVLVAPPPISTFDSGRCLELKASGKLFFGADNPSCAISEQYFHSRWAGTHNFLKRISRETGAVVVDFDGVLCSQGSCAVELDGVFLYRDATHLSHAGSRLLGIRMQLGDKLWSAAN